jgi:hypothetical protein
MRCCLPEFQSCEDTYSEFKLMYCLFGDDRRVQRIIYTRDILEYIFVPMNLKMPVLDASIGNFLFHPF